MLSGLFGNSLTKTPILEAQFAQFSTCNPNPVIRQLPADSSNAEANRIGISPSLIDLRRASASSFVT